MKENVTIEIKSKDLATFDLEIAKEWMDDLVRFTIKKQYEKANVVEVLDQKIGHDLFWMMSFDEWLKYRGYLTLKEALNLNPKKFKALGNIEEIDFSKSSMYLKTEIDFFNKHHLRFAFSLVDSHGMSKIYEFSVNLHQTKHLADLTLLQALRAFDFSVHIGG